MNDNTESALQYHDPSRPDFLFDHIIDRSGTGALKYDALEERFGKKDLLPLWVADMDFAAPPEVLRILRERVTNGCLGYACVPKDFWDPLLAWETRYYGHSCSPESFLLSSGVMPSVSLALRIFSSPGDRILIQTPVYYPFFEVVRNNNRTLAESPLTEKNNRYVPDFRDMEKKMKSGVKIFLLCNPHNPGGRVWTEEELDRMLSLCRRYGVLVLSDDIHSDIIFSGSRYRSVSAFPSLNSPDFLIFRAPSKTFNLAGLNTSYTVIPNPVLRRKFTAEQNKIFAGQNPNFLGLNAMRVAYDRGRPWLDALLRYLEENRDLSLQFLKENLPELRLFSPEGTYLLWIDFRSLPFSPGEVKSRLSEKAGLALSPGKIFGQDGFFRLNFGLPRSRLKTALKKLVDAFKEKTA